MHSPLTTIVAWLAVACSFAQQDRADRRLESIMSPRPQGWVVDQTGTIPVPAIERLNRLGDWVNRHRADGVAAAELVVVVVPTTEGRDARAFATELFNRWGVGSATDNNGVMVFAALDDRAAEIILGDGVDSPDEVELAQRIMADEMLPHFRRGDPSAALYAGAEACAERILRIPPMTAELPLPEESGRTSPDVAGRGPADFLQGNPAPADAPRKAGFPWMLVIVIAAPLLVVAGVVSWFARRKPKCGSCHFEMVLLGEAEDDQHLDPGQRMEEQLRSVDHRVWACPACNAVHKTRRNKWFTRYATCPNCRYRTKSQITRTIVAATTTHGGLVEVEENCQNCSYQNRMTRSTPRIVPQTSSSGSHSFSSGGGSSSGFGGGHSSGRGASGGW